jgi:hypothetical protein
VAGRADRGPQVGKGPAGAAARVQGGLPGVQADLGDGGRVGGVVVGEARFPGGGPQGEEGPGLGQEHLRAEAGGQRRAHAADHRPARVVEIDHNVGDSLRVDLGEVAGGGWSPVGVLVGSGGLRRAGTQKDDQLPGAEELGMLEEAAVHQHQVAARSAAVGGSFHSRAVRVEQVEGVQGHPPAAAATVGQYPSEVVGEGSGGGIVETVDRDMDRGAGRGWRRNQRARPHPGHGESLALLGSWAASKSSLRSGPWAVDRDRRDAGGGEHHA